MNRKILILIILAIVIVIITNGLIIWQTGFVVKEDYGNRKASLKMINQISENEKKGDEVVINLNSENEKRDNDMVTGDIIKINNRKSSGGGGSTSESSNSESSNTNSEDSSGSADSQAMYTADISVSSYSGNKDDEFVIDINLNTEEEIYGVEFELDFDPDILEVIEVKEGEFLKKDSASTYPIINSNNLGKIIFADTRMATREGISGNGVLTEIRFKAKEAGVSDLILKEAKIADTSLEVDKFQISIENNKVTIL